MVLKEEKGDLFKLDNKYVLAHCISEDCKMGAGIAVAFNKNFKWMKKYLLGTLEQTQKSYPCTILYPFSEPKVFNLITKEKYYNKPTYLTISKCIRDMATTCAENNIKYLAMPKIGCGLDKLQWETVKGIIEEEFKHLDIEIIIRYL